MPPRRRSRRPRAARGHRPARLHDRPLSRHGLGDRQLGAARSSSKPRGIGERHALPARGSGRRRRRNHAGCPHVPSRTDRPDRNLSYTLQPRHDNAADLHRGLPPRDFNQLRSSPSAAPPGPSRGPERCAAIRPTSAKFEVCSLDEGSAAGSSHLCVQECLVVLEIDDQSRFDRSERTDNQPGPPACRRRSCDRQAPAPAFGLLAGRADASPAEGCIVPPGCLISATRSHGGLPSEPAPFARAPPARVARGP
jgi:hypothetical protein